MRNVVSLVLGGGRGTRLFPLTQLRSKPAVPVAGKYRLIDIPLSNCINSGINRIYVLTQFNSVSLHRHIRSTYTFDPFDGGFVEILAAQQTLASSDWYQGTADAVRQNLRYFQQPGIDYVLILSGDQLYRMNFRDMIATHRESGADVTISAVPVASCDAGGLGIMRIDDAGRVVGFLEKPRTEAELDLVRTEPGWLEARGIDARGRDCLASMGIYLFNRDTLVSVLEKTDYRDFGREIFPASVRTRHVQVHLFDGYWEDIGTIRSFYQANLALTAKVPPFEMVSAGAPLFSRARFLPPSRIDGATIRGSLVADGCAIEEGAVIENSVIGLRCLIGRDVVIRDSVVMGNDYYQAPGESEHDSSNGRPPLGIGPGTRIEKAIIDKNCRIGRNVRIVRREGDEATQETDMIMVRDGIVVVTKGAVLPDGWTI
ncbi:MAG TPA: glucose-1-phosphate adenylyltransferase [Thermoguttaceae bacterium]|nr:glucose-1-phosphate adenylyltransferase [Thermoguttaceae bacterium]